MLAALLGLGATAYQYMFDVLVQKEHETIVRLSRNIREHVNQYMMQLQTMLSNLSGPLSSLRTEADIAAILEESEYLFSPLTTDMYFVTEKDVYGMSGINRQQLTAEHMYVKDIYHKAKHFSYFMFVDGPIIKERKGSVLTLSSKMRSGIDPNGVLSADINIPVFNESLERINNLPDVSMIVLADNGKPVISNIKLNHHEYSIVYPEIQKLTQNMDYRARFINTPDNRYIMYSEPVGFFNWHVVFFAPKDKLFEQTQYLKRYTLGFTLFFTCLIFIVSLILSGYINKPIKLMVGQMNKVRPDNMRQRLELNRRDEFEIMANTYNRMLERIDYLINENNRIEMQKRQYHIRALQVQINPHFLYNTLNSINALIDLDRIHEVPGVLDSLIQLLQYSSDKSDEFVTIETELFVLKNYIHIQKVRYANKFDVEYDFDPSTHHCKILKMCLQPIVENAIFHGMRGKKGDGRIRIGCRIVRNTVEMYVSDNGPGIPPNLNKTLLSGKMDLPESNTNRSIGLSNVHNRMNLHYGAEYGLHIEKTSEAGTTVLIRFPMVG
jgi:two-component system sensor histidine kinase YesM